MRIAKASDPETSLGRRATHASLSEAEKYLAAKGQNAYMELAVVCMLEMLSAKTSLTTCGIVVVVVVTLSSAMSASAASFHVGLRSPDQNELHCTDRFFPRWAKTTRATRDDPMTASLP